LLLETILNFAFSYSHSKMKSFYLILALLCLLCGCKGLIAVDTPSNELPASTVFANDALADQAVANMYYDLSLYYTGDIFAVVNGLTADELSTLNTSFVSYANNAIPSNDGAILNTWLNFYKVIYEANAVLEKLPSSSGVPADKAAQYIGEAYFVRAFCYYYLVNCWGGVPIITSTDLSQTANAARGTENDVYTLIEADLQQAVYKLPATYSGEKVRANKWAASALLARVYLQEKRWTDAATQASQVINSGMYTLCVPDSTFLRNSAETVLQIWMAEGYTLPGQTFIPQNSNSYPFYPFSKDFVAAFEPGDLREKSWTGNFVYGNMLYYYPAKYKKRTATTGPDAEYLMVLRLSEQYLVRAEALIHQNDLPDAISDINIIRTKAGLSALPSDLNYASCLRAVIKERRMELFTEWGDRWITLRRSGEIDSILSAVKQSWKPTAALYPIPQQERNRDTKLTQNPGYQ
jgi:starch-binding outer membrane protein, SusD/RagB family